MLWSSDTSNSRLPNRYFIRCSRRPPPQFHPDAPMTGGGFIAVNGDGADSSRLTGHSHISGPKYLHLPAMTIGLFGVQLFWSVEQSYGSPYLLSLGLSKSAMAMVFLAGPLSGLIMQPLIGVLADSCTSRFGRRRPYMIGGVLVCMLAMLLLGWTKQVAGLFTPSVSSNPASLARC